MRNFLLWLILQPVKCSRAIMAHLSYKINKIIRDYVVFVVGGGNGVDSDPIHQEITKPHSYKQNGNNLLQ